MNRRRSWTRRRALRFAVRFAPTVSWAGGWARPSFDARTANLGASGDSWCLSGSGAAAADGGGFVPFTRRLASRDGTDVVVRAEADLATGRLRFWCGGELLGEPWAPLERPAGGAPLALVPAVCVRSDNGGREPTVELVAF